MRMHCSSQPGKLLVQASSERGALTKLAISARRAWKARSMGGTSSALSTPMPQPRSAARSAPSARCALFRCGARQRRARCPAAATCAPTTGPCCPAMPLTTAPCATMPNSTGPQRTGHGIRAQHSTQRAVHMVLQREDIPPMVSLERLARWQPHCASTKGGHRQGGGADMKAGCHGHCRGARDRPPMAVHLRRRAAAPAAAGQPARRPNAAQAGLGRMSTHHPRGAALPGLQWLRRHAAQHPGGPER